MPGVYYSRAETATLIVKDAPANVTHEVCVRALACVCVWVGGWVGGCGCVFVGGWVYTHPYPPPYLHCHHQLDPLSFSRTQSASTFFGFFLNRKLILSLFLTHNPL
jgi:hypothetical protein